MGISATRPHAHTKGSNPRPRAVMIGNFTPRVCGIATFTRDLLGGLTAANDAIDWDVVAMNDRDPGLYAFGPEVRHVIQQESERDYIRVAWKYGLASRWPSVGAAYLKLANLEPCPGRSLDARHDFRAAVSAPG